MDRGPHGGAAGVPCRTSSMVVPQPPQARRQETCARPRPHDVAVLSAQPRRHPCHRLTPTDRRIDARRRVGCGGFIYCPRRRTRLRVSESRRRDGLGKLPIGIGQPVKTLNRVPGCIGGRSVEPGWASGPRIDLGRSTADMVPGHAAGEQPVTARQSRECLPYQRVSQLFPRGIHSPCSHSTLEPLLPHFLAHECLLLTTWRH